MSIIHGHDSFLGTRYMASRCASVATVSIIMPIHGCSKRFWREAIESILEQTYKHFEFIIVMDRVPDSEALILHQYAQQDGRIVVISSAAPGIANSLNEGVRVAEGKYIARMDCDDVSHIRRVDIQVAVLESIPTIDLVGSSAELIDEESNLIGFRSVPLSQSEIFFWMQLTNPLIHPSVMFRKEAFLKAGGYDSSIIFAQDYDLWSRMITVSNAINIKTPLIRYRIHKNTVTQLRRQEQLKYTAAISDAMLLKSVGSITKSDAVFLRSVLISSEFSGTEPRFFSSVKGAAKIAAYLALYFKKNSKSFTFHQELKIYITCLHRFFMFCLKSRKTLS